MIMTAKRLGHRLLHAPLRLDGHVHHVNGNLRLDQECGFLPIPWGGIRIQTGITSLLWFASKAHHPPSSLLAGCLAVCCWPISMCPCCLQLRTLPGHFDAVVHRELLQRMGCTGILDSKLQSSFTACRDRRAFVKDSWGVRGATHKYVAS